MKYVSVAIDGPSGAGKSTVARAAAAQLGYVYVDTGAMYRTIGLAVCRRGISGEDTEGIRSVLPDIRVGITYENGAQHVLLNGEDVSSEIRTPEIAYYASRVSAVPEVREFLLNTQRFRRAFFACRRSRCPTTSSAARINAPAVSSAEE